MLPIFHSLSKIKVIITRPSHSALTIQDSRETRLYRVHSEWQVIYSGISMCMGVGVTFSACWLASVCPCPRARGVTR